MTATATRQQVDLPAGPVHFREAGPADGRPVVFVHGFLVDDTLWTDVAEGLAARGFHTFTPTWPLGSHTTAMHEGADLSPRGLARVVLAFLAALDLTDVVLVGSDTGGAVSQLVLDEDPSRIARLVLTNCDAFETFPPFPFNLLFRLCRHPGLALAVLQAMRVPFLRTSKLGFGWLVRRRLTAEESLGWVRPYLTDGGVRRDLATFCRGWRRDGLTAVSERMSEFERPVLLCWAPRDPFFKLRLAERLATTFPEATLVEFEDARAFVALDAPHRLADEIDQWVAH